MDPSGLALSIFSVWTQICAFALKLRTAELDHALQDLKLQECAEEISAAIKNIQSVPAIEDNDILSLIQLIDLTIAWLSHFFPADVTKPPNKKHTTTLRLDSQLQDKFSCLQDIFSIVDEEIANIQLGSSEVTVPRPALAKYLSPVRKTFKQVKVWATRGQNASVWVLLDGPKMDLVIGALGVLTKRWSALAAKILPKEVPVQSALILASIVNRPIASSEIASSLLLSGSQNTPEDKSITLALIRNSVRGLLRNDIGPALWFHGPACSGKSTLAANLALKLEEFIKEDTPHAHPCPIVTMSHVQFVGDSSQSVILHDIMCQLAKHQLSLDSSTDRHASVFSPLNTHTTNTNVTLQSLRDYLSRSPLIMILDGVEAVSGLWETVTQLLKSYSNLRVICFSRDSKAEFMAEDMIHHESILPSRSLLESQFGEVVEKNPAVGPYVAAFVTNLSISFGVHYGLTSLFLTRLSTMKSEDIESLATPLAAEKYKQLFQRLKFLQRQERATALFCMVYLVALLGQAEKKCVRKLGHVIHDFMPVLFPDDIDAVGITDPISPPPPNSPDKQLFKDDFVGIFDHVNLDDLLLIDSTTVSLKDPNQAEQILYVISSRAPNLCNQAVDAICVQHHRDSNAVRLLREINKAFPESRFSFERHIKSGVEGTSYIVKALERAGATLSDRYDIFERVDMR